MYEVVIVLFLLVAIAMIALILVQQGKGAGMGASFGAGASNTVFGSAGSGNFLTKSTWILALIFFGICLFIGWMQKDTEKQTDSFSNIDAQQQVVQEQKDADVPAMNSDTPAANQELPADVPAVGSDVPAVNE